MYILCNLYQPSELKLRGLHSRYRLEKCTRMRSRSCVSPVRIIFRRNSRRAMSSVRPDRSKYCMYSTPTRNENSFLQKTTTVCSVAAVQLSFYQMLFLPISSVSQILRFLSILVLTLTVLEFSTSSDSTSPLKMENLITEELR